MTGRYSSLTQADIAAIRESLAIWKAACLAHGPHALAKRYGLSAKYLVRIGTGLSGKKPRRPEPRMTAQQLADSLADAYSTGAYRGSWLATVKVLRNRGYSDREVTAIIRSKWPRWAGDSSTVNKYGRYTSCDLLRFMDTMSDERAAVAALVKETFP